MANPVNRFNFRILETAAAYNPATAAQQPMTFFLCKTGEGWLGSQPLFGGDADKFNILVQSVTDVTTLKDGNVYVVGQDGLTYPKPNTTTGETITLVQGIYKWNDTRKEFINVVYPTIAEYITTTAIHAAAVDSEYNPSDADKTIMATDAIIKYVQDSINAQAILKVNFFKHAVSVTVTQQDLDDLANGTMNGDILKNYHNADNTLPGFTDQAANNHEHDQGLIFVIETLEDTTNTTQDQYLYVNLHGLINLYSFTSSDATFTPSYEASTHKTTVNMTINKATALSAINISAAADDLAEHPSNAPSYTANLSSNKFVTEEQFATILAQILKDYVKYDAD